jgi:hypothetical protein
MARASYVFLKLLPAFFVDAADHIASLIRQKPRSTSLSNNSRSICHFSDFFDHLDERIRDRHAGETLFTLGGIMRNTLPWGDNDEYCVCILMLRV